MSNSKGDLEDRKYVELHVHTNHCDGAKPEEVVSAADEQHLVAVVITDHQEVTGIDAVKEAARRKNSKLEVLPGIELSTLEGFDLLGYLIEHKHHLLREECDRIQKGRRVREEKIAKNLAAFFNTYDIPINTAFGDVLGLTINNNIAGGHFEMFIYDQLKEMNRRDSQLYKSTMAKLVSAINSVKCADDNEIVFDDSMDIGDRLATKWVKEVLVRDRLLRRKRPGHVPRTLDDCWSIEQAVSLLRAVKGVIVVAHPGSTNLDDRLYAVLDRVDGIEAVSSKHTPEQNSEYMKVKMTKPHVVLTAGTDWHGPEYSPHLTIGHPGIVGTGAVDTRPTYTMVGTLRDKQKEIYGGNFA